MNIRNAKTIKADKGFTIVELLIVIVIIGILAAITIVAYNGIQNRGKTSSAQSTAANISKKAEVYNADDTTSGYPATLAALTGAAASTTYAVPATSVTAVTSFSSTSAQNAVAFYKCGTGATTTAPVAPATNVTTQTGVRVDYYDFQNSSVKSVSTGQVTGLVGTYNIGCVISNS